MSADERVGTAMRERLAADLARWHLTDVEVRRGDTTTINVSLRSQDHD